MQQILIACINFNSYKELYAYLQSIDLAAAEVVGSAKVDVVVADNTVENYQTITTDYKNICVQPFPFHENLGYIGGATKMFELLGEVKIKSYDYVIISNVDLTLDKSFFVELLNVDTKDVGFIAPRVTTTKNMQEENPFMVNRASSIKMSLLVLMYHYPLLFVLNKLRNGHKSHARLSATLREENQEIYAGHGSIMVFTKRVVDEYFPFVYEPFMYGEEVYFAELVRAISLKTIYAPKVNVYNIGNVSTQLLGNKRKCKMSAESFRYLNNKFWKNSSIKS